MDNNGHQLDTVCLPTSAMEDGRRDPGISPGEDKHPSPAPTAHPRWLTGQATMRDNAHQQPHNLTFVTTVHCVNGEVTGEVVH